MADVTINYEGNAIATMSASGTKTLLTAGKYCDDDIEVVYVSPGGGGGQYDITGLAAIQITNNKSSGTMYVQWIRFNPYSSGTSGLGVYSQNINNGDTNTRDYWAVIDDGVNDPYVVFHTNWNVNSITYNNVPVPYTTAGSASQWDVHITIPTGFDNSYPFVFT